MNELNQQTVIKSKKIKQTKGFAYAIIGFLCFVICVSIYGLLIDGISLYLVLIIGCVILIIYASKGIKQLDKRPDLLLSKDFISYANKSIGLSHTQLIIQLSEINFIKEELFTFTIMKNDGSEFTIPEDYFSPNDWTQFENYIREHKIKYIESE